MNQDERDGLEIAAAHSLLASLKRGEDRLVAHFFERTHDNNIVEVFVYEKDVTLPELYKFADHFTDQSYRHAWEFYKTPTGLGIITRLL